MKYNKIIRAMVMMLLMAIIFGPTYAWQADKTCTIGYFLWFSSGAFKTQMNEPGYVEDENIHLP